MCDTVDDMDEFIEYELARDCIEIDDDCDDIDGDNGDSSVNTSAVIQDEGNEEFLYTHDDGYEIVEELEDEDDDQQLESDNALEMKGEILDQTEEPEEVEQKYNLKQELLDQDITEEDHLIEEDLDENGYINDNEVHEIEYEEVLAEVDEETEEEFESVIPDEEPPAKKQKKSDDIGLTKGPAGAIRRYMLFDELVACIVDYDPDGTPIVEFSISNSKTDEKLPMECGICPDVMARTKIPVHLRTHLVPGTTNRYQCIYCEETYKDCKYLAGHARRHMGIRPYVCELCKLYFSTKQDLRVHNQRRHQEKDHICEVCGKTFAQNTQLKRHREATHEKKRRFQCDHCPKSYYKNFSLQEHIRAVHMGKRRMIVCPFCGMQCRDAHKMARHRKQMHLHQTHFECHICNEEFTDINYFDAHKRSIQCRNNTRRKLEEESLLQKQQEEEQQEQQIQQQKHAIQIEDDEGLEEHVDETSQQYSQHSTELQEHDLNHFVINSDDQNQVQIIDEVDIKHFLPSEHHHHHQHQHQTAGQFLLNNDILQNHKVEILHSEDAADDEELVYEITIDNSNE